MMRLGTTVALALSLVAGATASQAPELAQQYRQRLNGALHELRQVAAQFEADAGRHALENEEALAAYERAEEPFLRDRGQSMRAILARFTSLERQAARLDAAAPALRPLELVLNADQTVLEGTMRDFEPAVPLTTHGLAWSLSGFLGALGLLKLLALPFRRRRRAGTARRTA